MSKKRLDEISKYLSYILRHNPGSIGLRLDSNGYVSTARLIDAINESEDNNIKGLDFNTLKLIVDTDEKQRYSFKGRGYDNYALIRANQGHSIVGLEICFEKVNPPEELYHGTSKENYDKIKESGAIKPMRRLKVHLSSSLDTAFSVGKRHGSPVVLGIDTKAMQKDGIEFFISENKIYLVDRVDAKYIKSVYYQTT